MPRMVALGGLGEIGLNALVVEQDGRRLLVDAGLLFSHEPHLGVDIIVPDFSYLLANPATLDGVVLTHGHEDHVGALPSLLRSLEHPVPIYGTRFTLGHLRNRLEQEGLTADLREMAPRHPFSVGDSFQVEPLEVTHSVPDATGLAIQTREGVVVHTGDFKLDEDPVYGPKTDLTRFHELGDQGVLCLLSDSTNSESTHPTPSERVVAEAFERRMRDAPGRILFSFFASNLYRAQLIVDLCHRLGRKLVVLGRGMNRSFELGQSLDILRIPNDLMVPEEYAENLPDRQVVILVTGSQGEPRSGLWQMTANEAGGGIRRGDTVILSARAIPGNERAIGHLINLLYARGATVITSRNEPNVHVSGHASAPEQMQMMRACRPKHFIPIHGELRHLHRHLEVGRSTGLSTSWILAHNGQLLELGENDVLHRGNVPSGRRFLDRVTQEAIDPARLQEREQLARSGLVVAVVLLDLNGRLRGPPLLRGKGLSDYETRALDRVALVCQTQLETHSHELLRDDLFVQEQASDIIRRAYKEAGLRKPRVLAVPVRR